MTIKERFLEALVQFLGEGNITRYLRQRMETHPYEFPDHELVDATERLMVKNTIKKDKDSSLAKLRKKEEEDMKRRLEDEEQQRRSRSSDVIEVPNLLFPNYDQPSTVSSADPQAYTDTDQSNFDFGGGDSGGAGASGGWDPNS